MYKLTFTESFKGVYRHHSIITGNADTVDLIRYMLDSVSLSVFSSEFTDVEMKKVYIEDLI